MGTDAKHVFPSDLKAICVAAMDRDGMRPADAETTAEVPGTTDTRGTHTHGAKQIRNLPLTNPA